MTQRIFLKGLVLVMAVSFAEPLQAQNISPIAESALTNDDIVAACVRGEAETLPLPFTDLEVNHWAFEAVMNLYYGCFAHKVSAQRQSLNSLGQPIVLSQPDPEKSPVEASKL